MRVAKWAYVPMARASRLVDTQCSFMSDGAEAHHTGGVPPDHTQPQHQPLSVCARGRVEGDRPLGLLLLEGHLASQRRSAQPLPTGVSGRWAVAEAVCRAVAVVGDELREGLDGYLHGALAARAALLGASALLWAHNRGG